MSNSAPQTQSSPAWTNFTIATFVLSAGMMAGGIFFMEASFAAKGFYAMASVMLVHTSISVTKTLRDNFEQNRLVNRLDEAKTEALLRDVDMHQSL